jgi:hypothetical protein
MRLFGFEGSARLWVIFEYVDRAYAERLLPDHLRLATSPEFPAGKHPMMYSFGTQTVAMRPFSWLKTSYRESIVGVCSVELNKGKSSGPYSLMTAMPVTSLTALVLGRLLGFPKTMKRIAATDDAYAIATFLRNNVMVSNTFEPTGPPDTTADPHCPLTEKLLVHPVISRAPWGTLLASRFQIDESARKVTPVAARGRVTAQDLAGLPGGSYRWPRPPVDGIKLGAFLLEHKWRADWPSRVPQ